MSPAKLARPAVVFATHAFSDAMTGPAVFARYLWTEFADHVSIDFHLVAPDGPGGHPQSHRCLPPSVGATRFYRSLISTSAKLAESLGPRGLIHLNAPHYGTPSLPKGWSLWLQLNDYEGPQLLSDFPSRLRENGYRRFLSLLIRRCLERRALGRCELALANSDYTRREVLSAYKEIPDSRIITLHKAVDLDFFDGPKSQLPISGRRFVFLGSNFEIKRLHLALEAFERLDSPSSTLEIAGCKLDEFIARHPRLAFAAKGSRVRFHGRLNREEVRSLLLRSDVLLLPSRQEAFGVAALEAIACGCRVIASRVGGLPEIVDRPGVGRLLEEATPAAWVYAMREELETPAIDERLRASVTTRFSSKTMLGRLAALYADKLIHEPLQ